MTLSMARANVNSSSIPHTRNPIAIVVLVLATAALAGCATQSPHTRAAAECWMSTEKTDARMNLDKRADIVNKCIDDKMKAAGM
jgi:type IV pilus biogenesis protein CpaD/CtpE